MQLRALWILGALCAVITLLFALGFLLDDGKRKQLLSAPGLDLIFPGGVLLQQSGVGRSILGAGTYQARVYGTDADEAQILAFFDAQLGTLGYQPAAPTLDPTPAHQWGTLLRQYDQGTLHYRLYLGPLPYPIGAGRRITTGYQHILVAKLGN